MLRKAERTSIGASLYGNCVYPNFVICPITSQKDLPLAGIRFVMTPKLLRSNLTEQGNNKKLVGHKNLIFYVPLVGPVGMTYFCGNVVELGVKENKRFYIPASCAGMY